MCHFFVKLSGFRFATSNVATVIIIAASITICAMAVMPKTHILPIQIENAIPHIQARSCIIKCLTLSSGMCLRGLCLAFITEFQELYINSLTYVLLTQIYSKITPKQSYVQASPLDH